jgi:hypothetical protein
VLHHVNRTLNKFYNYYSTASHLRRYYRSTKCMFYSLSLSLSLSPPNRRQTDRPQTPPISSHCCYDPELLQWRQLRQIDEYRGQGWLFLFLDLTTPNCCNGGSGNKSRIWRTRVVVFYFNF